MFCGETVSLLNDTTRPWQVSTPYIFVMGSGILVCFTPGQLPPPPPMLFSRITKLSSINEPVREKTNNLGSDQVQHKPGCTVTEDG